MVDDVHVDRHPLALDGKVGNEDWRDGAEAGAFICVTDATNASSSCFSTASIPVIA